ncbi:MAG: glutathione S-transferase family protein [Nevskia sp.]|nr:glutathione S-transferase family protein [Nevskia sp.]
MQLYVFPPSPRARKPLAVVHHLDLPCEIKVLDLVKGEQKRPEYLKLNPNGRMPTLVDGDFVLWESNAIIQYLADKKPGELMPVDARGRAEVQRWLCWDLAHWDPACASLLFENMIKPVFRGAAPDPAQVKEGEDKFRQLAPVLDAHLASRDWLLGKNLSVADFALAAPLHYAGVGKIPVDEFANIKRWYGQLASLEAWRKSAPPPLN